MGLMTSSDLKVKLDQAQEKVNKRVDTIKKICKKLDINFDNLMVAYVEAKNNAIKEKKDWLPSGYAKGVVAQFVQDKPTRLPDGSWDESAYDYNDKVSQLEDNLPKLFDVEKVANNWRIKYDIEFNKENAPKIQVLVDFLNEWGEMATSWYHTNAKTLVDAKNQFHKIAQDFLNEHNYTNLSYDEQRELVKTFNDFMFDKYYVKNRYRFSSVDSDDWVKAKTNVDNLTIDLSKVKFEETKKSGYYSYDQNFGHSADKGTYVLKSFDDERLAKIIEAEKKAKYEDLCNRISAVVGEINDVSNLRISAKGNLDGIVMGTKGGAKVETIGAGGYNTGTIVNVKHGQIFHYRVLVHKLK